MTDQNLNAAIESYGRAAKGASQNNGSVKQLLGFGAAAGGLFVAGQADADIVYSGVINTGFNISTINNSSTNAINGPLFSSTGGALAFILGGNNRGPANPVGSTDMVWAVGASYAGGYGNAFAAGPAFPTTIIPLNSGDVVGAAGTAASLAWAMAGLPGNPAIDPLGIGSTGTGTAFFGFTFRTSAAATQLFGWARIQITNLGGLPASATIIDWAYENMGNSIQAGAVPAPGALALLGLAAGAAGIRRRRAAA